MALNLCTGRTESANKFDNPPERQWSAFGASEYFGPRCGKHSMLWLWLLSIILLAGVLVIAPANGSIKAGPVNSKAIEARKAFARTAVESEAAMRAQNEPSLVLPELLDGNLVQGAAVNHIDSSGNPLMFRQLDRSARKSQLLTESMLTNGLIIEQTLSFGLSALVARRRCAGVANLHQASGTQPQALTVKPCGSYGRVCPRRCAHLT